MEKKKQLVYSIKRNPCPICGGRPIPMVDLNTHLFFVECEECGHASKVDYDEKVAANLWNSENPNYQNDGEKNFLVHMTEKYCTTLIIKAKDEQDAQNKTKQLYRDGTIEASSPDCNDCELDIEVAGLATKDEAVLYKQSTYA